MKGVRAILLGLLISGGMLIPGNIPNIISACKMQIGTREWAQIGIPLGLAIMGAGYFSFIYLFKHCQESYNK
jgi:predicted cation transporter